MLVCNVFTITYNKNNTKADFIDNCESNINAIIGMQEDLKSEVDRTMQETFADERFAKAVEEKDTALINEIADMQSSYSHVRIYILSNDNTLLYSGNESITSSAQLIDYDFVKTAMNGQTYSDTVLIGGTGPYVISAEPIKTENGQVGILCVSISFAEEELLDNLKNDSGAEYTVIANKTRAATTITLDGVRQDGTDISDEVYSTISAGNRYTGETEVLGEPFSVIYEPVKNNAGEVIGALFTGKSLINVNNQARNAALISSLVGFVVFLIELFIQLKVIKKIISDPLAQVVEASDRICKGDLGINIDVTSQDEIGKLQASFNMMASNLRAIIGDLSGLTGEMATGNFLAETECQEKYIGDYEQILSSLNRINDSLNDTLLQIDEAANEVNGSADQVSNGAQQLAQGATEQAASIDELSATIRDVVASVNQTSSKANEAAALSAEAGGKVSESNEQMRVMIGAMDEISEKSNAIGKIIKAIEDIAFQTNILALNAAVEAARAGSAGKGFAVVADEVRNLAQKSADAAKNTTALIEGTVSAVEKGVKITDNAAKLLDEVAERAGRVNTYVDEISDATAEIRESTERVSQGIEQIAIVVTNNSATAEESAAASEELNSQAASLRELVGAFRLRR